MRLEDFWLYVDKNGSNGCWLWLRSKDTCGYGHLVIGRKHFGAHRIAYKLCIGLISSGLELDHLCRVRHCVNPAHLQPVTHRKNILRGMFGNSNLTHDNIREIRRRGPLEKQQNLAEEFGVSRSEINMIVNRKHWIHIKDI